MDGRMCFSSEGTLTGTHPLQILYSKCFFCKHAYSSSSQAQVYSLTYPVTVWVQSLCMPQFNATRHARSTRAAGLISVLIARLTKTDIHTFVNARRTIEGISEG
jgi:hypothetical protein